MAAKVKGLAKKRGSVILRKLRKTGETLSLLSKGEFGCVFIW